LHIFVGACALRTLQTLHPTLLLHYTTLPACGWALAAPKKLAPEGNWY
jgi:hypothetical protein